MSFCYQLDSLPTETLLNVFQYLRGGDLHSVKQTCQRLQNIIGKFKDKLLPPPVSSVQIIGNESADMVELTIRYPNDANPLLLYIIRNKSEGHHSSSWFEKMDPRRVNCLEGDEVKMDGDWPKGIKFDVVAHTSVLETLNNILRNKVNQPYLSRFLMSKMKLNKSLCYYLEGWIESTQLKLGAVEFEQCKIETEAEDFHPLVKGIHEIRIDQCTCIHGSSKLFLSEELRRRIATVRKLCLRPWVSGQQLYQGLIKDLNEDLELQMLMENPDRSVKDRIRRWLMQLELRRHMNVNDGANRQQVDPPARRIALRRDGMPVRNYVRQMEAADEARTGGPGDDGPYMPLGGRELLSTSAKDIVWGSHSSLTIADAIQVIQECLSGTRSINMFTLEHWGFGFPRALNEFCSANMNVIREGHYKFETSEGAFDVQINNKTIKIHLVTEENSKNVSTVQTP